MDVLRVALKGLGAFCLLTWAGGCGWPEPIGPIAGGRLHGNLVSELVDDWTFSDAYETIAVETRPRDPYSVTTWSVAKGGALYVPTRDPSEKAWVHNVRDNPNVRLKIGDSLYERTAVHVTNPDEFQGALAALIAKYGLDRPEGEEPPEVWFFRMDPR